MRYDKLLAAAYLLLAQDFGVESTEQVRADAKAFGEDIESWQPFPDTVNAMQRLGKYYKLVPLSNVDKASFKKTCEGPLKGVPFWRVYVAEDIGSYKPDVRNFGYLIQRAKSDSEGEGERGIEKGEICQVAQSLMHDHVPAKKMGMSSVWVSRVWLLGVLCAWKAGVDVLTDASRLIERAQVWEERRRKCMTRGLWGMRGE